MVDVKNNQNLQTILLMMSLVLFTGCANLAHNTQEQKPSVGKSASKDIDLNILIIKAEQGDAQAQYKIGYHYRTKNDFANTIKWYSKAADQGDGNAMLGLGNRYSAGEGVAKDKKAADSWYKKAFAVLSKLANKGNAEAQNDLAKMYYYGLGVSKDSTKAYWYSPEKTDTRFHAAFASCSNCIGVM